MPGNSFVKLSAVIRKVVASFTQAREQQWAARGVILRAALRAAHSTEPDEDARHRLKEELASKRQQAQDALTIFSRMREQFDTDRAYRLLHAAMTDTPVQPIAAECYDLFLSEEQLGRMPLSEAFAFLAKRQPMLHQFERAAAAADGVTWALQRSDTAAHDDMLDAHPHVSTVLGPGAQDCTDPLLRSQLALSIASQHLAIIAGSHDGDDLCSYFASPKKRMTLSSGFNRSGL
jgi:hypothetical protein